MSAQAAAILKSTDGTDVPLRGVSANGRLTGLLFELTVEQTFENAGKKNIEAVYTFPVPIVPFCWDWTWKLVSGSCPASRFAAKRPLSATKKPLTRAIRPPCWKRPAMASTP